MKWETMKAADRLTRARSLLVMTQPFFGCLALHLEPQERPDITRTMATDGRALFYSAPFVESLSEPELVGVWGHEVMHCAYGHHVRLGARELKTFNVAADYCVNRDLVAAGFKLPASALLNSAFDGMGAEEIYAVLMRGQQPPQPQAGQSGQDTAGQQGAPATGQPSGQGDDSGQSGGQPDKGQASGQPGGQPQASQANGGQPGADGAPSTGPGTGQQTPASGNGNGGQPTGPQSSAPGPAGPASGNGGQPGQDTATGQPDAAGAHGMGGIIAPANPADAAAESDRWQVLARQAANVAKAQNAGNVPGYLRDMLAELAEPRADFRDLLANWIDSRVASDYSFSRPNRRFVHAGYYMPGAIVDGLEHVVFAVDTSGSITAEMIQTAMGEIVGAMESGKFQRLTVAMADTRVASWHEFQKGDDVDAPPAGGGGTDFRDTFRQIAERAPDASAVVYLTDLEVHEFGEEPACPVLWAVHGDSRRFKALAARVPFGEPVYIGRL